MLQIEKIVRDFLGSRLSCPVLLENTEKVPKRVLIEKTGGGGDYIFESTLAIQSYGASLYEASALNSEIASLLLKDGVEPGLLSVSGVISIELNSNYNYTDTSKKEYRYQAVYDVVHY